MTKTKNDTTKKHGRGPVDAEELMVHDETFRDVTLVLEMSFHNTYRIKMKLAMKARQNISQWIRMRNDNKIRFNAKSHWSRTKL
ncbi:RPL39 [Cordylochernes scorpioides]|uniref:Large ribosomal subunit protein eL39 n=1 Tax=Cordylochernes scorpioides TaxID=51811 RepID=A0ABY6LNF3_9ARAC|nr:RPL39 [Cordylochernes scorpioides]